MKITKRGVISVLLAAAMILSAGVFAACGEDEDKIVEIKYNIKITSSDGSVEESFDGVHLEGTANELTVLKATEFFCKTVMQMDFDYDATIGSIKKIGPNISGLFISEYEIDEEPGEEQEAADGGEDGEEEETEETVKDYYYDWVCTVNGVEAQLGDVIKEGYSIVWEWKEVAKELVD